MFCPNCGTACGEEQRFCIHCGTDLHPEAGEVIIPRSAQKKGSRWVPILILVILSAVGIGVFFATSGPGNPMVQSDMPWFSIKNGELHFDESLYTGGSEVTVPNQIGGATVLFLSDECFAYCDSIAEVHLPDSLLAIGYGSFEGCTALRGVYIPDSVTYIGDGAFYGCTALEAVCIPSSVNYIGSGAFDHCDKLFYIFYPGSIDDWALLYDEFINPYTGIYCEDGSFYQGGNSDQ